MSLSAVQIYDFHIFLTVHLFFLIKKSHFAGKVKVCSTDVPGSICQVAVQVPQVSPEERSGYEITHRYIDSDYA